MGVGPGNNGPSKKPGRKPTPAGEKKPKDPNAAKSPAVKKQKEIQYVKLFFV